MKQHHVHFLVLVSVFCVTYNSSIAQEKPNVPYIEQNVCPFECCQFGRWQARTPLRVYKTEGDTSKVSFHIAIGDTFRAVTGNVHMEEVGVVVVTKAVESFKPGDTLYTLSYGGEGFIDVWHKGKVSQVEMFWDYDDDIDLTKVDPHDRRWENYSGVIIAKPLMIWWVKVVLANGQTGWLRLVNTTIGGFSLEEGINGMDGCG